MARPTRPRAIPDLTEKTSMATGDILLLTRLTDAPDDYENFRITYDNFVTGLNIPAPVVLPGEFQNDDDLALDFFDDYAVGSISTLDEGFGWQDDGVVTGGTIVSRTRLDGRTFNALSMLNGQLGRKMPWGDNWNKLRMVVAWRINASATFTTVNTEFFGVCSGTANMVSSATTDNAIGLRWGSAASESISFNAGTRVSVFNLGTSFRFISRRGTTNTLIASGGNGHHIAAVEGYMAFLMLRISRPPFANDSSSVSYALLEASTSIAEVEHSRGKSAVKVMLRDDNSNTAITTNDQTAGGCLSSANTSVSFDQSTGKLDTINLTWPETTNPLELCALGVRKIS